VLWGKARLVPSGVPSLPRQESFKYNCTSNWIDRIAMSMYTRLFRTEKGYFGLGYGGVEQGDKVCVLFGCPSPMILRKIDSYFVVVGHACVVGLMDGEAIESLEDGDLKTRTFEIH
jgi:hypothetical protein